MKKSIKYYIGMVLYCIVATITYPFFWIHDKYVYYSEERGRLIGEVKYLKEQLKASEELCEEYRDLYVCGEYWQSSYASLRKLLSAHGVTNKQISKNRPKRRNIIHGHLR